MIKLSEINEGFWKDGIKRAKSGEERLEDKLVSNIHQLKPIDMGFRFLVADDVLSIDDIEYFDEDRLQEYKNFIHENGWRLMTVQEARLFAHNLSYKLENDTTLVIKSPKTQNTIKLNIEQYGAFVYYWIDKGYTSSLTADTTLKIELLNGGVCDASVSIGRLFHNYKIILVKDKNKSVSEGFWKDSIKRAKTGEKRIEDRFNSNIGNLNTVDLGVDEVLFADKDLIINGDDSFEWDDVKRHIPLIEKEGWRIPTIDEMKKWFFRSGAFSERYDKHRYCVTSMMRMKEFDDEPYFIIKSWETEEEWYFHLIEKSDFLYENTVYWLLMDGDKEYNSCGAFKLNPGGYEELIVTQVHTNYDPSRIRLVKDRR